MILKENRVLYYDGESQEFESVFNRGHDVPVMSGPGFATMKELYICKYGVHAHLEHIDTDQGPNVVNCWRISCAAT